MSTKIARNVTTVTTNDATPTTVATPTTPDVRPMPVGFDTIRDVIDASGINHHTDMSVDAIRADIATVTAMAERMAPGVPVPPRNRGRFTGLRTYDFQNTVYHANDGAGWRFTDRTLIVVWALELPANKCDFAVHADYIGLTRNQYRNGKHGSNVVNPAVFTSRAWTIAERGAAQPRRSSRKRAARADAMAATMAAPTAVTPDTADVTVDATETPTTAE